MANPNQPAKFLKTERAWVDANDPNQTIPQGQKVSIARRADARTKPWCVVFFDLKQKTITTASHNATHDRWVVRIPADVMRAGLPDEAKTGIKGDIMHVAAAILRMARGGSFRKPVGWEGHEADHIPGDKLRDHLAFLRPVKGIDNIKNTDVADQWLGDSKRKGLLIAVSKRPNDPQTAWTILASHSINYAAEKLLDIPIGTLRYYMRSARNGRSALACGGAGADKRWAGWFVRCIVEDPEDRAARAIREYQAEANRAVAEYADKLLAEGAEGGASES